MKGWRKLEFIGCFLLVAILQLALIFQNPSETSTNIGCSFFYTIQQTCALLYRGCIFFKDTFLAIIDYIFGCIHTIPLFSQCSLQEIKQNIAWSILSWKWWLILMSAYWSEPPKRPGKVNGTYWMNIKADLYK